MESIGTQLSPATVDISLSVMGKTVTVKPRSQHKNELNRTLQQTQLFAALYVCCFPRFFLHYFQENNIIRPQ